MDNELMLFDRLEVIKTTIAKYGEDNFYLSFSGGKDSTILHYLLDEALPNNKIPRVYIDTGIEYLAIREFVLNLAKSDERIKIIKPTRPIIPTLQKYGYPFKSKEFAKIVGSYQLQKDNIKKYLDMDKDELKRYMLDHKEEEKALVGEGVFALYYIKGIRGKRDKDGYITSFEDSVRYTCPKSLLYLFSDEYKVKTSNLCCTKLKKEPVHKWEKANGKTIAITGMRRSEGGKEPISKVVSSRTIAVKPSSSTHCSSSQMSGKNGISKSEASDYPRSTIRLSTSRGQVARVVRLP